jgi:hypothetical protein
MAEEKHTRKYGKYIRGQGEDDKFGFVPAKTEEGKL